MNIDWSKAPEGAEYAGWSLDELFWYRNVSDTGYEMYLPQIKTWLACSGRPGCDKLIPRPVTDELRHQLRSALNIETRDPSDAAVEALASDMAKISKTVHEPQNGMQWCGNEVDTVVELVKSCQQPEGVVVDTGSEWQNGDECFWARGGETGFKFVALHPENKEIAVVWAGGNDYRHCFVTDLVRPEQRERDEAIDAMFEVASFYHCNTDDVRDACERLYDAGYRK